MGTHLTCRPYRRRNSAGSGSADSAYLQLMGRQASCNRESISRRFAVGVPSGRTGKVTGGAKLSPFSHL